MAARSGPTAALARPRSPSITAGAALALAGVGASCRQRGLGSAGTAAAPRGFRHEREEDLLPPPDLLSEIRSYWDVDAATYDRAAGHAPRTLTELAAWAATLRRLLPPPPARILDVGAGTGFLSLLLAQEGYEVSALDVSASMLARLAAKAAELGLGVRTVEGDAAVPPRGGFDAVVERHLLWTLPDPGAALEAWHDSAPQGRLVLIESEWGTAADPLTRARAAAREVLRRVRRAPADHHGEYPAELRARLPLGTGTSPEDLLGLVNASSWRPGRIERLRDVEWAARRALGSPIEQLLGVTPRFAVVAG